MSSWAAAVGAVFFFFFFSRSREEVERAKEKNNQHRIKQRVCFSLDLRAPLCLVFFSIHRKHKPYLASVRAAAKPLRRTTEKKKRGRRRKASRRRINGPTPFLPLRCSSFTTALCSSLLAQPRRSSSESTQVPPVLLSQRASKREGERERNEKQTKKEKASEKRGRSRRRCFFFRSSKSMKLRPLIALFYLLGLVRRL